MFWLTFICVAVFAWVMLIMGTMKKSLLLMLFSFITFFVSGAGAFHIEVPIVLDNIVDNVKIGQYATTYAIVDPTMGLLLVGFGLLALMMTMLAVLEVFSGGRT